MAVLDPTLVLTNLYNNNAIHKIVLFSIKTVSTGDTIDLSTFFSKLQRAAFFPVTADSASLPQINGGVITFAATNLINEAGVLLVIGAPS